MTASPAYRAVPSLDPGDRAVAEMLVRRAALPPADAAPVFLAVALLSRARGSGHSALELEQLAAEAVGLVTSASDGPWHDAWYGDAEQWGACLRRSGLLDGGGGPGALVLTGTRLQFRRYYDAERRIAARIGARLERGGGGFRLITGGPGSGKTTTVANEMVRRVEQAPGFRIALAAPTGKAAARLSESMRLRLDELEAPEAARVRVPLDAKTLHRLLRYLPATDRFRADANSPVPADLVVVDEASMIDVLMMDALLGALAPTTGLIVVGDHHQLASVEAGDVLGSLVRAGLERDEGDPLREAITELSGNYRFRDRPGIGALAAAARAGDAEGAVAALANDAWDDAILMPVPDVTSKLIVPMEPHLQGCLAARSPRELLDRLDGFRILCAEREGPRGVAGLNAAVERWLAGRGVRVGDAWYHGRPVMVTANDYATQVFNGDLGVCWHEGEGTLVHFPAAGRTTRAISPERLPATATAWAMTVHKAQGSEFGEVLFVLPRAASPLVERALFYTAVTRAKTRVIVVGDRTGVRAAVGRAAVRTSGIGEWLRNG